MMCEARVEERGGLCGPCWRETPFLQGLVCHACGSSLPGEDAGEVLCDTCLALPRPWEAGRAAISYRDAGRRVVLALKHRDRLDLVPAAAEWLHRAGQPLFRPDTVLVPVPVHWTRLLTRRYNQAAELCRGLARVSGLQAVPDALLRTRRTPMLDGLTVAERFDTLSGAIKVDPERSDALAGRDVCVMDDVMTSGATLAAATGAIYAAGAERVCVLVLARVEKDP